MPFAKHYFSLILIEALRFEHLPLVWRKTGHVTLCLTWVGERGLPNILTSYMSSVSLLLTLPSNTNSSQLNVFHHRSPHSELGKNSTPYPNPAFVMFGIFLIPSSENVLLDYSGCHGCRSDFLPDLSFVVTCLLYVRSVRKLFRNSSTRGVMRKWDIRTWKWVIRKHSLRE